MSSNASAYYHWPTIWVGSKLPTPGEDVDVRKLEEEVYRTTLPAGIIAKVLRDGMFVFDFSDWPPGRALPDDFTSSNFDAKASVMLMRASIFNAHLACLYSALYYCQNHFVLDKMVVSPSDLILLNSFNDFNGMSFGDIRVSELTLARYPSTYRQDLPKGFDWRLAHRLLVSTDTVAESFRILSTIIQNSDQACLFLTELCLRSCKAYEEHNYSLSLVSAWTVTEYLLQRLWNRYIDNNRQRKVKDAGVVFINNDRKERLTKSRDFTASVISEILSLCDVLPFSLYQELSKVRTARNNWLHDMKPVTREDALRSTEVAQQMINLVDKLNLRILPVTRMRG